MDPEFGNVDHENSGNLDFDPDFDRNFCDLDLGQ